MIRTAYALAALVWLLTQAAALAQPNATMEAWRAEYRRPEAVLHPAENPFSPAKERLGRMLFFDPLLSGSGTQSCASCHNPALSWGNGLRFAVGELGRPLRLRVPSLIDVATQPVLGWDGKFPDLESVAFGPITAPGNMNNTEPELLRRLSAIAGYVQAFGEAFPGEGITRGTIERALATFERTIVAGAAPFDRWIEGNERAIDASARRGFVLFNGKAGCAECHHGPSFTDGSFQDIGSATGDDIGRAQYFPGSNKLTYAFKVATLRNVARRAPYMHDGSVPTLEAVVELYDRGGIERPSRSELIRPLGLTADEKAALIAFLRTLDEEPRSFAVPVLPR
ncbi:MAG: cytochrome c peroxidase [Acetobacteraceae bacterium]